MSCSYAHLDGVYVLGALAAGERADYERHLSGCDECSRALRDLAGIPGLLGRVEADDVERLGPAAPVPPTLLPSMVAEARRSRGRRRVLRAAAGTAAAVLLVLVALGIGTTIGDDSPSSPAGPDLAAAQRMEPLGTESSGWVSLTGRRWGTQIDLTCTYEGPVSGEETYVLVVRDADGRSEQVGTWRTAPGEEVHVTMATALAPADIATVEVQTATGYSVLRLDE